MQSTRAMWNGVFAAAAVFCVLALAHALAFPPLAATDEAANLGYALSIADGDLPTLRTPIPDHGLPGLTERLARDRIGSRPNWIWTANHPPLYYATIALPLKLGLSMDAPRMGIWLARGLDILWGGAFVVATGWFVARLLPKHPRLPIIAALWVATLPAFAAQGGLLYCDQAAHALGTCCITFAWCPQRTSTRSRVLLGGLAVAAMLTRISGVVFVEIAAMLWVLRGGSIKRALAVFMPSVVAGLALAARSIALYGEVSGSAYNLDKLGRPSGRPIGELLSSPEFHLDQLLQLVGKSIRSEALWESPFVEVSLELRMLAILALFGLPAIGLIIAVRRQPLVPAKPWIVGTLALLPIASLCMLALHTSRGGYEHVRYLFMALPVVALVVALGLEALPRWLALSGFAVTLGFVVFVNLPAFAAGHWREPDTIAQAGAWLPASWLASSALPLCSALALVAPLVWLVRSWRALKG